MILSNLYQGLVMSSTLVPKFEPVIRSIEDLPKPSVKIIVWKGTAAETLIQVVTFQQSNQFLSVMFLIFNREQMNEMEFSGGLSKISPNIQSYY